MEVVWFNLPLIVQERVFDFLDLKDIPMIPNMVRKQYITQRIKKEVSECKEFCSCSFPFCEESNLQLTNFNVQPSYVEKLTGYFGPYKHASEKWFYDRRSCCFNGNHERRNVWNVLARIYDILEPFVIETYFLAQPMEHGQLFLDYEFISGFCDKLEGCYIDDFGRIDQFTYLISVESCPFDGVPTPQEETQFITKSHTLK